VTADHGEQFGERDLGLVEHGNSLYAPAVRVPLLIRYPAALPAGVRVARSVGIRRLAATALRLADAAADSPFPGPSLAVEADGAARTPEPKPARSLLRPSGETWAMEPLHAGRMMSVVWRRWHYIRNGDGSEEFYDLTVDPWERNDRSGEPALADTIARLRDWADAAPDPIAARQDPSASDGADGASSSLETAARSAGST
jgi:arylsulfatase